MLNKKFVYFKMRLGKLNMEMLFLGDIHKVLSIKMILLTMY